MRSALPIACLVLLLAASGAGAADFCAKGGMGARNEAAVDAGTPGGPPGPDPVGGVGGTGISAGLAPGEEAAVVGTITQFGSVCVNGEHVRYRVDTPTSLDGVVDTTRALQLGQVVRLHVVRDEQGELVARRIAVIDAVAGPVTERDEAGRWFSVMGRRVFLGPDTMFGNAGPAVPEIGARIAASGIARPDGRLVTTRVQGAAPGATAFVSGMVTELDGRMMEIEGVAVRVPKGELAADLKPGVDVAVRGTWSGDGLDAEDVVVDPLFSMDRPPAFVSVEGFLDRCAGGGHAIGGVAVRLPVDAGAGAWLGRRVIATGRPAVGGELVLESLRTSPLADAGAAAGDADGRRPERVCRPLVARP